MSTIDRIISESTIETINNDYIIVSYNDIELGGVYSTQPIFGALVSLLGRNLPSSKGNLSARAQMHVAVFFGFK